MHAPAGQKMQDKSPFQVSHKRSFQMNTEFSGFSQPQLNWFTHSQCRSSIIYPYFNQGMYPFSFHKTEDMHTNQISFIFKVWPKGVRLQLGTKVTPPTVPQKPTPTPGTCSSTLSTTQTTTCLTPSCETPCPTSAGNTETRAGPSHRAWTKFTSSSCHWRTF